jgi:cellulose synthase (UDP-forming)
LSRQAIEEAGGMCEFNIAEDFLTSLFVHDKGWNSVYVGKVLAEGLAPEDFLSYYKQQFRWTRGSLEVIFKYNPLFKRGLRLAQRLQYLISASYYLSGVFVLIDALLPVIFLYTGITAVQTSTMALAAAFLPYIALSLYALQKSANFSYTFNAIAYSLSSFWLQIRAVIAVLRNEKTSFSVTSKQQIAGNFLYLTIPHITYISLAAIGLIVGLFREGLNASLIANASWATINCVVFSVFIKAAAPARASSDNQPTDPIDKANIPVKKPQYQVAE